MGDKYFRSVDQGFRYVDNWELKYIIFPRRCWLTKKWCMFKHMYVGSNHFLHPEGKRFTEYYRVEANEFLKWQLSKD